MRIAVVGGGISGLTCAYRLQNQGHEVVVFERDLEVGGRMSSVRVDGFTIDIGTNLLLDNYRRTQALAKELGIHDQWFAFHAEGSGGILREGKLTSFAPQSAAAVLGYQGLSLWSRLRLLVYLIGARRWVGELDFFDLSIGDDKLDGVEAERYARGRLGDEIFDWLFDPFVRTFHFHGAGRISMKYFNALASLLVGQGGFTPHGFRKNMGALSHALEEKLVVHRGTPVKTLRSNSGGVTVELADRTESFDSAVLATPATISRVLLSNPSAPAAELLGIAEYASTVICAYRVPRAVACTFEGMWIPFAESKMICFCTNETRKGSADDSDCLMVFGLHEEAAFALLGRSDQEIYEVVSREWCRLFPQYEGKMKGIHAHRWRDAIPVYAPGLVAGAARFWQNGQGDGNVWLCGDYLNHPWVEGSIHCGEKIAARIGPAGR